MYKVNCGTFWVYTDEKPNPWIHGFKLFLMIVVIFVSIPFAAGWQLFGGGDE